MRDRQLTTLVLLLVSACGASSAAEDGAGGTAGALNIDLEAPTCPVAMPSGAAGMATDADTLALAKTQYERCSSRCDKARAGYCVDFEYGSCIDYCLGWQNRTVNDNCTVEIGAYIDCWGTVADSCMFPSGPVPQTCVAALAVARCCLGLSPSEEPRRMPR